MAYFASDRIKERDLDIYKFQLYSDARPVPVSYMKGRVYDSRSGKGLEALFQLINLETGEIVIESVSSPGEGYFLIPLPVDRDYALNISNPGYLFYSDHFSFRGIHIRTDPYIKDVAMNPILQGEKVILNNIFYDFNSWALLSESMIELKKITEFMNLNPTIKIEISGHTDSIGNQTYNIELSEKRAKSVVDYLIKNAISADRLNYKGYGSAQPILPNDTEEGRARNRRTELRIIK
jgi:outer membrane protein OmpA-like peptidoglycan-associated protein